MKIKSFIISLFLILVIGMQLIPHFYFLIGQRALKNADYVSAYKNLKASYFLNSKNSDYRYNYVIALSHLKPAITVQKEIFRITESDIDDSARYYAEQILLSWRQKIANDYGDNYIEQVPMDNEIIRWDSSKFPLLVALTNDSNEKLPDYYHTEIVRALGQWQSSTSFIKFKLIDDIDNANIIIKISSTPKDICNNKTCRYIVGYTTPEYKGSTLKNMTINLYDKDANGNYFSDKELFNTVLHETGHALGIMGHSYSSEDLMYMSAEKNFYLPYRSSFQYLSSKDINTIKLLYKLIPDITNTEKIDYSDLIYPPIVLGSASQISYRKIKEAKNYIKKAPDVAVGYIDLASAYSNSGRDKDAIKLLKKALAISRTDNEKYMSLYNLAVIYLNLKKYQDALEYADKAQKISNSEDVKDLIMNINHLRSLK